MFHFTFIRFYLRLKVQNGTRITKWDLLYRLYISNASVLKFETFDRGLKVSKCKSIYVFRLCYFTKAF